MHYADFAAALLREIKEKTKATDEIILGGSVADWNGYQKASARRAALLEVEGLIATRLNRTEAR